VLRDWNSGTFARYSTPLSSAPPTESSLTLDSVSPSFLTPLYAKDEEILAVLPTRKEIRRKGGLVKLSPSEVEERKPTLEENWIHSEADEVESSDDVEGENGDSASMVLDNEEEEEEEESERETETEEQGKEQGQGDEVEEESGESSPDSESEDEKATPAVQSRKQKRKRREESLAPRPAKRVSLNPIILGSKGKKDRLRQYQNLSVKSKKTLAMAPKVVTTPKSILKKPGASKGRLSKEVPNKLPTGNSKKDGEGNKPETYDFGRFF